MENIATPPRWFGSFGNARGFSLEVELVAGRWRGGKWAAPNLFRLQRLCVAKAHMQAHDFAGRGIDMEHCRRSDDLLRRRVGVNLPVFLDGLFGDEDDWVGRDILEHVFLFGDGDKATLQEVADHGFFSMRGGMNAFQMADDGV